MAERRLWTRETQEYYDRHFGCISGKQITMPIRA